MTQIKSVLSVANYPLAERRCDTLNSLPRFQRQRLERLEHFLVRHAGAEISPTIRSQLHAPKLRRLSLRQPATTRLLEAAQIKLHLLLESAIEKAADLEILLNGTQNLRFTTTVRECFNHQRVELCMLYFFNPVMFEQTLKLRIEFLIVFDAFEVVTLHHPLDMKRRDRNREWIVNQDCGRDRFGWPNDVAERPKSVFKFHAKLFEELDMFRFFTRELQQRTYAEVVAAQLWTRMVQHERKYEFFY